MRKRSAWERVLPVGLGRLTGRTSIVEDAAGGGAGEETGAALTPSGLVPMSCVASDARLIVPPPENSRFSHLGWPKIVRAPSGTLVLGCIAGPWHFGGGCPAICRSTDGGKTFSELTILAEYDETTDYRHCGNIALGVAPDGALILLAMAFTGNVRNTIVGWRSEDEGMTWSPVDTTSLGDNRTGSVYGEIIDVPGVGFVVFGHYRVGAKPHSEGIWFSVSSDCGRTWGEDRFMTGTLLYEPSVTFADGRFVGLIRNDPASYYTQLVSDDLGRTWEETQSLVGVGEKGLPSPFVTTSPADPNELIALLTKRGAAGELGFIELWKADCHALDWHRVRKLISFPLLDGAVDSRSMDEYRKHPHELPEGIVHAKTDFGYPWLTDLGAGRWLMVFYCGNLAGWNGIYGLELELG